MPATNDRTDEGMNAAPDDRRADDEAVGCPHAESVPLHVLGEADYAGREEFERHLGQCDACRAEVRQTREIVSQLRTVPQEVLSRDLAPGILARIPEHAWTARPARPAPPVWWRAAILWPARVAAAAVIVMGFGFLFGRLGEWTYQVPPTGPELAGPASPEAKGVESARQWLVGAQEPAGNWDATRWGGQNQYSVGLTSLAVLALVGGERAAGPDGRFGAPLAGALSYLVSSQAESGRFGPECRDELYNHGLAASALLEAYAAGGRTAFAGLTEAVDAALAYIRARQLPDGGWGYRDDGRANAVTTIWQLQALTLAQSLGWEGLEDPLEKGLAWLGSVVDANGRVGYSRAGDFKYGPDTLVAMAAFYLFASGNDAPAEEGRGRKLAWALTNAAVGESRSRQIDFYRWYFLAYATRVAGERAAEPAVSARSCPPDGGPGLAEILVESQVKRGPDSGSWEPSDRWSDVGGRVYSTALAALTLDADSRAPRLLSWMGGARR